MIELKNFNANYADGKKFDGKLKMKNARKHQNWCIILSFLHCESA